MPADWSGGVDAFVARTLHRWAGSLAPTELRSRFGFYLMLSHKPHPEADEPETMDPNRLFLVLEPQPNAHTYLRLGPVVKRLEAIDRRFPSMFWHRFAGSLRGYVEVWDHETALEAQEWGGWWYDDETTREEMAEEGILVPSQIVPASLRQPRVDDAEVRRALQRRGITREDWAGRLLWGALDLQEMAIATAAAREKESRPTEDEMGLLDDFYHPWPSLAVCMSDGDGLAHLWDAENDAKWNGGGPFRPLAIMAFDATRAAEVRRAYEALEAWSRVLGKAAEIATLLLDLERAGEGPLPLAVVLNAWGE